MRKVCILLVALALVSVTNKALPVLVSSLKDIRKKSKGTKLPPQASKACQTMPETMWSLWVQRPNPPLSTKPLALLAPVLLQDLQVASMWSLPAAHHPRKHPTKLGTSSCPRRMYTNGLLGRRARRLQWMVKEHSHSRDSPNEPENPLNESERALTVPDN